MFDFECPKKNDVVSSNIGVQESNVSKAHILRTQEQLGFLVINSFLAKQRHMEIRKA